MKVAKRACLRNLALTYLWRHQRGIAPITNKLSTLKHCNLQEGNRIRCLLTNGTKDWDQVYKNILRHQPEVTTELPYKATISISGQPRTQAHFTG